MISNAWFPALRNVLNVRSKITYALLLQEGNDAESQVSGE